jgi:hypothetical protein
MNTVPEVAVKLNANVRPMLPTDVMISNVSEESSCAENQGRNS